MLPTCGFRGRSGHRRGRRSHRPTRRIGRRASRLEGKWGPIWWSAGHGGRRLSITATVLALHRGGGIGMIGCGWVDYGSGRRCGWLVQAMGYGSQRGAVVRCAASARLWHPNVRGGDSARGARCGDGKAALGFGTGARASGVVGVGRAHRGGGERV